MKDRVPIQIIYEGLIRNILDRKEETYVVPSNSTIHSLVENIIKKHGKEVEACLLISEGYLHPSVQIYINGQEISHLKGLETPITEEGEIVVKVGISDYPGG